MALYQIAFSKLRRNFIYGIRDLAWGSGFNKRFYQGKNGSRIITYHGICQSLEHTKFNTIFLNLKTFEQQLIFYKNNFNVVSLDDYYAGKFSNDKFNICLTFDDGFANNYNLVLPLLEKYQVPAAFFITGIREAGHDILWNDFLAIAGKYGPMEFELNNEIYKKVRLGKYCKYLCVSNRITINDTLNSQGFENKNHLIQQLRPELEEYLKAFEEFWLQMTTNEIRKLSLSRCVIVGSHGYYHNNLTQLSKEGAKTEMLLSKKFLEDIIDKEVNSIAFPYGSYNDEIVQIAKATGYSRLLAVDFNCIKDKNGPAIKKRMTINPFISVNNQMNAIIKGKYE